MQASFRTLGHGTASRQQLLDLLTGAGVATVVDVRRFPGSRAHPHVRREALAEWLPAAGIAYRWEERLGGRRRLADGSPDVWWQVPAFRAYAGHMRTAEFAAAMDGLLRESGAAVMCSESLWWRCHRRLIADFGVLARGAEVRHLQHDGRLTAHTVAAGARLRADGLLVYDRIAGSGTGSADRRSSPAATRPATT
jgi:uncharacterized protein (DUF488 family)